LYKKYVIIGIVLLFVGASAIPTVTAEDLKKSPVEIMPAVWHVDDDGNEYPNPDFNEIQDAIDAATGGDEIRVYAGFYDENINVDKSLDIIGGFNGTSVIDGGGNGNTVTLIATSVRIEQFTIQNSGGAESGKIVDAGISIQSGLNVINQNRVEDNLGDGIFLTGAAGNEITNCYILNNSKDGIGLSSILSGGNTISGNTIGDNGEDGINMFRGHSNFMRDNIISGNQENGIHLLRSRLNTIERNYIGNSGNYGIYFELICLANSISRNNITGNTNQGFFLKFQCDSNTITLNNFMDNNGEASFLYCCHVGFLSCFLNGWRENYFDDHDPIIPNWWYLMWGRWGFIPWPNFDLYPVAEPYDWPPE
jgi:parallel beta-helix repeat protein